METTFDVPLQTFLRVVYGDDGVCLKKFHEECGGCHAAVVPPWIATAERFFADNEMNAARLGIVGATGV